MPRKKEKGAPRRRSVNLTIPEDVIEAARALGINASKAAEAGMRRAIAEREAERWLEENAPALRAHNARIEEKGTLLTPGWADEA